MRSRTDRDRPHRSRPSRSVGLDERPRRPETARSGLPFVWLRLCVTRRFGQRPAPAMEKCRGHRRHGRDAGGGTPVELLPDLYPGSIRQPATTMLPVPGTACSNPPRSSDESYKPIVPDSGSLNHIRRSVLTAEIFSDRGEPNRSVRSHAKYAGPRAGNQGSAFARPCETATARQSDGDGWVGISQGGGQRSCLSGRTAVALSDG